MHEGPVADPILEPRNVPLQASDEGPSNHLKFGDWASLAVASTEDPALVIAPDDAVPILLVDDEDAVVAHRDEVDLARRPISSDEDLVRDEGPGGRELLLQARRRQLLARADEVPGLDQPRHVVSPVLTSEPIPPADRRGTSRCAIPAGGSTWPSVIQTPMRTRCLDGSEVRGGARVLAARRVPRKAPSLPHIGWSTEGSRYAASSVPNT